ncbi:unannotated protein [freshwater metagenome]|uniref:Unannotated protein n=1 Tax=freshwater metagenome TaxID=449393 RepID=A0A6J6CDM1_9ZZZZ
MISPTTLARGERFPSTATSSSRATTASSTTAISSYSKARSKAASSSSAPWALVIPIEEPMFAGFTKMVSPNSAISLDASSCPFSSSVTRTAAQRGCAIPAASSTVLAMALSMATAEPNTPAPTYGTCAISSRPCTVPSSPFGPCRIGNTTVGTSFVAPPRTSKGCTSGPSILSESGSSSARPC